jgi:hypothetical protein
MPLFGTGLMIELDLEQWGNEPGSDGELPMGDWVIYDNKVRRANDPGVRDAANCAKEHTVTGTANEACPAGYFTALSDLFDEGLETNTAKSSSGFLLL